MNALLQRVVAAIVLVGVLLAVLLLLPPLAGVLLIGLVMLMGGWEWAAFCGWTRPAGRAAYALLVALCLLLGFLLIPSAGALLPLLCLSLACWALAFVAILRYPRPIGRPTAALAGIVALVPGGVTVAVLLDKLAAGAPLVLLMLVIVWSADVGAYFVGRRFGRLRLAPRVSPGKTWEGMIGGWLAAGVAAAVGGRLLAARSDVDLSLQMLLPLGVAIAAISVVGDLTVSMFKRNVGLKDSGRLIPGHGGILDRVDSIVAATPLYALVLLLAGVIR